MRFHHNAVLLTLPLLTARALFRGESRHTGTIQLLPGIEHLLILHAVDGPVRTTLSNRGPAAATVGFETAKHTPEVQRELPTDGSAFELDSDGGTSTLRLRSTGTATLEFAFISKHGIRLEWTQR